MPRTSDESRGAARRATRLAVLSTTVCTMLGTTGCGRSAIAPVALPLSPTFVAALDVDGRRANFLVDTGSELTLFDTAAARRLGLPVERSNERLLRLTDATGTRRDHAMRAGVRAIAFGDHVFAMDGVPAVEFDTRLTFDGILGMDVLSRAAWCFDAPASRLLLCDPDGALRVLAERGLTVRARVPVQGTATRWLAAVTLGPDHVAEMLIDSGAERTSLPAKAIARLALGRGDALDARRRRATAARAAAELRAAGLEDVRVEIPAADGAQVGLHGAAGGSAAVYHLPQIELGGRAFADLIVVEQTGDAPVLGRDVISGCAWLLHGPRREIWLLEAR